MDPRIVWALTFWTHSEAYLLTVPLIAVAAVAVFRCGRERARLTGPDDSDQLKRIVRRQMVWATACAVAFLAFGVGFVHLGCAALVSHERRCLGNAKELSRGLLVYAYDYDERFPPADRWADVPQLRGKDAALRCPTATSLYGYGMNRAMGCVNVGELAEPSKTVLMFEADAQSRSFNGGKGDVSQGRHSGGETYAFCDGFARWTNPSSRAKLVWEFVPWKPDPEAAEPTTQDLRAVPITP